MLQVDAALILFLRALGVRPWGHAGDAVTDVALYVDFLTVKSETDE